MENVLFVDKPLLEDFNVLKGNINASIYVTLLLSVIFFIIN